MECSSEVSNRLVTKNFAESEEKRNKFSFNISSSSRSLRRIVVMVTIKRNTSAGGLITNLSKKLLMTVKKNYDANQSQINDIADNNSFLLKNCINTWWWPDDVEGLV